MLKNKLIRLYQQYHSKEMIKDLFTYIKQKIHTSDYIIPPYELKHLFQMDRKTFLKFIMDSLISGVFEMQWEIHCPK